MWASSQPKTLWLEHVSGRENIFIIPPDNNPARIIKSFAFKKMDDDICITLNAPTEVLTTIKQEMDNSRFRHVDESTKVLDIQIPVSHLLPTLIRLSSYEKNPEFKLPIQQIGSFSQALTYKAPRPR